MEVARGHREARTRAPLSGAPAAVTVTAPPRCVRIRARVGRQWYHDLVAELGRRAPGHVAWDAEPADLALVDSQWWVERRRRLGDRAMREVAQVLTDRGRLPLVAVDHCDVALPKFSPADVDRFALVLKAQALPRDRELMNWKIGPRWGLNRCAKVERVPAELRLSEAQIDKHRLSLDLGLYLAVMRGLEPPADPRDGWDEALDAVLVASFNSLNRLRAARVIAGAFAGVARLVALGPEHPIAGVPAADVPAVLARARADDPALFGAPVDPAAHRALLRRAKTVPALSGIGELGLRHYEALAACRALVCENVDHLETVYPFAAGENYAPVADDAHDFAAVLRALVRDRDATARLALRGLRAFVATYRDPAALYERLFVAPLRALL